MTAYTRLLAAGLALGGHRPNGLASLIRSPDFQLSSEPVPFPLSLLSMMEISNILSFFIQVRVLFDALARKSSRVKSMVHKYKQNHRYARLSEIKPDARMHPG